MNQIELAEPNWRYEKKINNSTHYLNCPKHLLNNLIYHNARQKELYSKEDRVKYVHEILRVWACKTTKKTAIKFVEAFENLSFEELYRINPNNYRDNQPTPKCILDSIADTNRYNLRLFGRIV